MTPAYVPARWARWRAVHVKNKSRVLNVEVVLSFFSMFKTWDFALAGFLWFIKLWLLSLEVCPVFRMDMSIGTLAGVWPELFGHIVLRNFDSLSSFPKWASHSDQRRSAKDNFELKRIASCPPALSSNRHFFSSPRAVFLCVCTLKCWIDFWELPYYAIITAGQAVDWTPVNSAQLHILSCFF